MASEVHPAFASARSEFARLPTRALLEIATGSAPITERALAFGSPSALTAVRQSICHHDGASRKPPLTIYARPDFPTALSNRPRRLQKDWRGPGSPGRAFGGRDTRRHHHRQRRIPARKDHWRSPELVPRHLYAGGESGLRSVSSNQLPIGTMDTRSCRASTPGRISRRRSHSGSKAGFSRIACAGLSATSCNANTKSKAREPECNDASEIIGSRAIRHRVVERGPRRTFWERPSC